MSDSDFSFGKPKRKPFQPPPAKAETPTIKTNDTAASPPPQRIGFQFGDIERSINPHAPPEYAMPNHHNRAEPLGHAAENSPPARLIPLVASKKAWYAIAVGGVLALIPYLLSMSKIKFMIATFGILVHEFGHAVFGWLFARPSIPAFDFRHGGGLTSIQDRSTALLVMFYLVYGWLLFALRKQPIALGLVLVAGGLYSVLVVTGLDDYFIIYMGHGTELLFIAIFFYRAFSGSAVAHQLERYAYGFCAFGLLYHNLGFAWTLLTDRYTMELYLLGKPGVPNDFVKIAHHIFNVGVNRMALFHLVMSGLAVGVGFGFFRYRSYLIYGLRRALGQLR